MLVMEYQHGVAVDRLPDCVDYRVIDEPTELDAADFGSELPMNRPNLHVTCAISRVPGRWSAPEDPLASCWSQSIEAPLVRPRSRGGGIATDLSPTFH